MCTVAHAFRNVYGMVLPFAVLCHHICALRAPGPPHSRRRKRGEVHNAWERRRRRRARTWYLWKAGMCTYVCACDPTRVDGPVYLSSVAYPPPYTLLCHTGSTKFMSAFDESLFLTAVDDRYKCPICFDVCGANPLQHTDRNCERIFCAPCIKDHIDLANAQQARCPMCREPLHGRLEGLGRLLREEHGALRLRCPNHLRGCNAELTMATVAAHQEVCGHTLITCPYPGCGAEIERGALAVHEQEAVVAHMRGMREEREEREEQAGTIAQLRESSETALSQIETMGRRLMTVERELTATSSTLYGLAELLRWAPRCTYHGSVAPNVIWICRNVDAIRQASGTIVSPELRFSSVDLPQRRYSFQVKVWPNGRAGSRGCVSVTFILRPGPDPAALEWPIHPTCKLGVAMLAPPDVQDMDQRAKMRTCQLACDAAPAGDECARSWAKFVEADEFDLFCPRRDYFIFQFALFS